MAVYLVQHGKSLSKETDPEQGLSEEGIAEVKRIAEVAKGYNVKVSEIWHSTKKRAGQTAEIFASYLDPEKGIREVQGLQPLDDVAAFAASLESAGNIMVAGHMPFMQRLISWLVVGAPEPPLFKIQNGGIICMDREGESGSWIIKWALMPTIE